jgi:hypothetical protein
MNAQSIVSQVKARKGQHVLAVWERAAKTFKDCPMAIMKRTTAYIRAGIEYANLAVNEGVETGELPWGEWSEYPFIITHKGKEYVRLYPASFANLVPSVAWTIDGKPATLEQVKPYLLASELREKDEPVKCFTLKAEDVLAIAEA